MPRSLLESFSAARVRHVNFLVVTFAVLRAVMASATTTTTIPLHQWFVGPWNSCSAPCGQAETRDREVYCHETCSVYRCTQVAASLCTQIYGNTPSSMESCGTFASPCPTSSTTTSATNLLSSTVTSTERQTTTTSTIVGQTTGLGSPTDWECIVVLGQSNYQNCVQGAEAMCGVGCPCCRRKDNTPIIAPETTPPSPSPKENEGSSVVWVIVLVVAIAIAVTISCGIVYAVWKAHRRSKLHSKIGGVVRSPLTTTQKPTVEAWKDDTNGKDGRDAWDHPFEQPPDAFDIPRKPGRNQEDDSTAASSYCDDDPLGNKPMSHARTTPNEEDFSDDDPDPFSVPGARRPKTQGATRDNLTPETPKRSRTAATDTRQRGQKAAEKAFAGFHEQEKAKARNANRSPHPKGTAVPPRKNEPPPAEKMGKPQSTTGQPQSTTGQPSTPGSPQANTPDNSTNANNKPLAADLGASTVVSEHIARLDAELDANRKKDVDFRKQHFKELCLKWHPDKNTNGMGEAESSAQANEIFKHLLSRRGGYLS